MLTLRSYSHTSPDNYAESRPSTKPSPSPHARQELEHLLSCLRLPFVELQEFNYLASCHDNDDEKPYKCQLPAFGDMKMRNLEAQSYPVKIRDITGHEDSFTLEESAFQFIKCPVWLKQWSEESVCRDYLPTMQEWLKQRFGAEDVKIYNYNVSLPPICLVCSVSSPGLC
jgi:hypothetical protein